MSFFTLTISASTASLLNNRFETSGRIDFFCEADALSSLGAVARAPAVRSVLLINVLRFMIGDFLRSIF
jgi:hypothetical protein